MDKNLLIIKELEEIQREFENERDYEIQKIKDVYDRKIESVAQTLSILQKRAGIDPEKQAALPLPLDYPKNGTTADKARWALTKLGGGPARQITILNHLRQYEPTLTRGALGNAMARDDGIVKISEPKKRPRFRLRVDIHRPRPESFHDVMGAPANGLDIPIIAPEPMLKSVPERESESEDQGPPFDFTPDDDVPY